LTIERFARFIDNVRKLGYDEDRAVRRLSQIDNLDEETSVAGRRRDSMIVERDKAIVERNKEQARLNQLKKRTGEAEANLQQINGRIAKASIELVTTLEKSKKEMYRIEFAEALCELFGDIEHVPPKLLVEVMAQLNLIIETKFNPAAIYPIDYKEAREKALLLLEHALGKSLVPREVYDEMLHSTIQKHDDLMLDQLGKIERERKQLGMEKAEALRICADVNDAILEKLLPLALKLEEKNFIVVKKCRVCRRTLVAFPAGVACTLQICPFCHAMNPSV
jgi:hypothetical protein